MFIDIFVAQIQINLILVRVTFTFISIIGVTLNIAIFFLELFFLKELLEHQVHCDGVEGVAGGRTDLIPSVGLEVLDLAPILFDQAELFNFLGGKRGSLLSDKVPT